MSTTIRPEAPTSVVLRPMGSAIPLGLAGLAVASLLSAGFSLQWFPRAEASQVGVLLLVTVVPLQAAAAVFALLTRDGATAGALGLQAAIWAATGASHLLVPPGTAADPIGLVVLAGGGLIVASATTIASSKVIPGLAVGLAGLHFVLTGIYDLGGATTWQSIAGIISLVVVGTAGYSAWALEVEDAAGATRVPLGRRDGGRAALTASYVEQVNEVTHEPGVRAQL